ncbi:hypothetical protein GCM10009864_62340 [Streptomyces lunalinharesii]|uniref:Uncharacterized protein n=1 Tax=Streptomyces lunalinharesii TaxID=333384 RepID=A0ABP6F4X3_9ACTN
MKMRRSIPPSCTAPTEQSPGPINIPSKSILLRGGRVEGPADRGGLRDGPGFRGGAIYVVGAESMVSPEPVVGAMYVADPMHAAGPVYVTSLARPVGAARTWRSGVRDGPAAQGVRGAECAWHLRRPSGWAPLYPFPVERSVTAEHLDALLPRHRPVRRRIGMHQLAMHHLAMRQLAIRHHRVRRTAALAPEPDAGTWPQHEQRERDDRRFP